MGKKISRLDIYVLWRNWSRKQRVTAFSLIMKRLVIGTGEDFLQIYFEMLEEISLVAQFNGLFFDIRREWETL